MRREFQREVAVEMKEMKRSGSEAHSDLDDENNRAYRNIVYNMEQDGITQEDRVMH